MGHSSGALRGGVGRWLIVAVLLLLAVPTARAEDTIMLNDGKMYSGTILSETEDTVVIDTVIGTIPTKLTIDRGRVTSIVRGHRTWKPPPAPEGGGAEPAAEGGIPVMEIPIVGEFGADILPISFRASLEHARRYKVEHIVLRIDSPGGSVWAAREILQLIEASRGEFEFHALVESAISAAIWPTFACETIHIAPRGSMGGAVAYTTNGRGSVEVDAKMNSIIAAEIVSIAEPLGHSGDVIRAMILMASELYASGEGEGLSLAGSKPADRAAAFETIDGPTTVLTLTTGDATRLGVASGLGSASADELLKSVGVEEWKTIDGAGLMARWSSQCDKRRDLAVASAEKLVEAYQRAESTDDIDEAIDALVAFQREHPRFAKYANEFWECYPMDESINRGDVAEMTEKVRELIKELRRIKREGP